MTRIDLHPDRLLPAEPAQREIARRLHEGVRGLPIVSPHGHVDPVLLLQDRPFDNPADLFVTPDHYVTRMLHAHGVPLSDLGVPRRDGEGAAAHPRETWRRLCERWDAFRGTPSRYWLEAELAQVFDIPVRPSATDADLIYDGLMERFALPEYRPRALFERFGVEVLATTDDPCSDLSAHRGLRADPTWKGRVVPTFRADAYLDPSIPGWAGRVERLGRVAGIDTSAYRGYIEALEARRAFFAALGATATDQGPPDAGTLALAPSAAAHLFAAVLQGRAGPEEQTAFRRHMLCEMARMSCDDGLVMQLHPGVCRDHHPPTWRDFGTDVGADIPVAIEFTRALRPLLDLYGTHPNFRIVLFTLDETTWSRELAPLAGFYPSVYLGAPWWFLDTPDAMLRFRAAVTDTAGFAKTSGFVDDTRAFCSLPVRHDAARRIDCTHLSRLVAEHRLDEDEAAETARDLAHRLPREVFRF
ncbi:MAG: glucuronate isomerase [Candidatus Dormibacteria bacterium]